MAGNLAACALSAILGAAIGALVRNQIVGVVVLLVVNFAVIPLIVGGRSEASVHRAATLGDGWLGIWVSPRRYGAVTDQIAKEAVEAGRDSSRFEHALNVWCGFGASRCIASSGWATACLGP